jgi:hypothetical protein
MNKNIVIFINLIITLSSTTLYSGGPAIDTKNSFLHKAMILMNSYPMDSYTQPLLSSSSASQCNTSTSAVWSTSEKDIKRERDIFTEDLFPGLSPLHLIAQNISELEDKEIKAYQALYSKMIGTLLPYFPQGEPPQGINTLRPVTDERSYTVHVFKKINRQENFNILNRISPDQSYDIFIPLFKPYEEGNLKFTAPKTTEEAYGSMANTLADFTSFRQERRLAVQRTLKTVKVYSALASFIGTTVYWAIYYNDPDSREAGNFWLINVAVHLVGTMLSEYPIHVVKSHMKRNDQYRNTQEVMDNTPIISDVNPLVISLARQYVSHRFNTGLEILNNTNGIGAWVYCCPVIFGIKQFFKIPLKDMPETTRITMLLEGSYDQLQKKLYNENPQNSDIIAAQRVQRKYDDILSALYPLNEQNIDIMVARTKRMELNQRKRNYLTSIVRSCREQLKNCLPIRIKNKAGINL